MTRTTKFEYLISKPMSNERRIEAESTAVNLTDEVAIVTSASSRFMTPDIVSVQVSAKVATLGEIQAIADRVKEALGHYGAVEITAPTEALRSSYPMPSHADPEQLFEMRAAFGEETETVNVLTGARTNLRTGKISYPNDYQERCERIFGDSK